MRVIACRFYDSDMRNFYTRSLLLSTLCVGAITSQARAFDDEECSQMVRACLSRPTESRDVCFESASVSPTCIGSQVGEIAAKRSHFAPMMPQGEEGPAFLGPEIVDRGCLGKFDAQLGSTLEIGPLTREQKDSLSSQLDRCNQMAPSELYRP
jgi:hypothetical protein